jgi:hypothetical protein
MREQARSKKLCKTHTKIILYIYPINNIPLDGPYNKNYLVLFCNYSGRSSPHSLRTNRHHAAISPAPPNRVI